MSTTPASSAARSLQVGGLHVEVSGPEAAPVLLFGHSLLFDGRMWEAQVADLVRDFRCVNVDFQGHGRSGRPAPGFTMAEQAEDYRRVLDALGVDRAVVVGLSMGGMAALHLALAHPARVRALALLDTSADAQQPLEKARIRLLAGLARVLGLNPFLRRQAMAQMFSAAFRRARPDVIAVWDERFAALDREGALRAIRMVITRPSIVDRVAAITVPTLVVCGRDDVATPPRFGLRIAERIAGAERHTVPTGHLSAIEAPGEVTALLRSFVGRVLATG